jgi:hypothetical protein
MLSSLSLSLGILYCFGFISSRSLQRSAHPLSLFVSQTFSFTLDSVSSRLSYTAAATAGVPLSAPLELYIEVFGLPLCACECGWKSANRSFRQRQPTVQIICYILSFALNPPFVALRKFSFANIAFAS